MSTLHLFDDKGDYLLDLGLNGKNGLLGGSDESCSEEGSVGKFNILNSCFY